MLHESILAFDPDAEANVMLEKLRAIRDASEEERERRIKSKSGKIEVEAGRIKRIANTTKYYFGDALPSPEEGAAALEDSEYEKIGST